MVGKKNTTSLFKRLIIERMRNGASLKIVTENFHIGHATETRINKLMES